MQSNTNHYLHIDCAMFLPIFRFTPCLLSSSLLTSHREGCLLCASFIHRWIANCRQILLLTHPSLCPKVYHCAASFFSYCYRSFHVFPFIPINFCFHPQFFIRQLLLLSAFRSLLCLIAIEPRVF